MRTTTETVTTVYREQGDPKHIVKDFAGDHYAIAAITVTVDNEGEDDGEPVVQVRIAGYKVSKKTFKKIGQYSCAVYGPIETVQVIPATPTT